MSLATSSPFDRLLPRPRTIIPAAGAARPGGMAHAIIDCDDGRVRRAWAGWLSSIDSSAAPARSPRARVAVAVDGGASPSPDGYRLAITPEGIEILGASPAGCFYGLQTLRQLAAPTGEVPCCTILDQPRFAVRGLLHDVTRGKVPTPATLQLLADRLASLKINQLQLYIEHAFLFASDAAICPPDAGLTPDEVRAFDAYCRERFIDLVPALANLGHMGRILAMPRYRHLAEIEATRSWEEMTWPERMRGFTLDVTHPEARRLVERMWNDVLDAFSGPVVNICGDEPWDLGRGRNKERLAGDARAEAYVQHLRRVHDFCAARGRRTQLWSDVIRNYPHLLSRLPRESAVLHWGYDDQSDYEGTARFVATGLPTVVCPGTSGWKRTLNAVDLAERNIATFAAAGVRHGAAGLLNTDWGDHGHFNLLAASWHGIALGACCAWDGEHATGAAFDAALARWAWGWESADPVTALRAASRTAERCETWRLLWLPVRQAAGDASLPTAAELEEGQSAARDLRSLLSGAAAGADHPRGEPSSARDGDPGTPSRACAAQPPEAELDVTELALAAGFTELALEKMAMIRAAVDGDSAAAWPAARRNEWADRLGPAAREYEASWRRRNKPSGLADITRTLADAAEDVRRFAG